MNPTASLSRFLSTTLPLLLCVLVAAASVLFLAASGTRAAPAPTPCPKVSYDFDGDGVFDLTEAVEIASEQEIVDGEKR